ncbi:hypothetical protein QR680_019147 [Steinernema hermaphroditum]|uniref:K Homology domain-containing protein n=1 Tax=Steinernema hermaphroditum TaxID=289476 RepID=A0AA39HMA5_9BILA|nr:hypothetical protein QR680_019147 [Steinernema hermaphroditum]
MRSNAVKRPPINAEMTAPEQIDEVAQKLAVVSRAPICRAARGEPDRTKSIRKKTIKQRKKKASGERLDVEGGDAGVDEQIMDDVAAVLNWMCDCVAAHYELVVRPGAFTRKEKAVKIHKRTIKIPIPEHPDGYKYIGRILGPRGISIRAMERDTGCKIAIRGRGSLKDPEQEELLRNCRGYKHLKENLHVRVTTEVDAGCSARLKAAEMLIRELLKPVDDNYKQEQMLQLSMINGTYRPGYSILQEVEDDSEWAE